jgi:acyl-CoA ligase (AMP-forming) (exosortase A-associated)
VTSRPAATLDELLDAAIAEHGERTALVDGDVRLTYAEVGARTGALAAALAGAGLAPGDRVGIYLEKSWQAVVAMLAASRVGAAFVNVNPALKAAQVTYIANDCDIRVLIGNADKLAALPADAVPTTFHVGRAPEGRPASVDLDAVLTAVGPDARRRLIETDLATILYTSGSTGMPKGVAFSQRNLVVGAEIVSGYLENTADDRILSVLPFSFDYGLNQLTTAIRVGAQLVIQRSQLPGDLLRNLRRHEITGVAGVPPVWSLLLRNARSLESEPLASLRYITNSGGRIPQANLDLLRRLLPATRIFLMYGLTEAFRSTYLSPEEIDRGSECIGRAIPDTEILVIKDGRAAAPGEVGELVHRGPTVALGYWGNPEETARAYRPNPLAPPELLDVERVVYSGDLVRMDEDGYLYFVGRNDAMIKSGGFRISPEEVENVLIASGLVHEACAFGAPDPEEVVGQVVVAVVSLRDDAPADAVARIRDHVVATAPSYMVPHDFVVVDELPKGATGKIDRPAVARAYLEGERAPATSAARS